MWQKRSAVSNFDRKTGAGLIIIGATLLVMMADIAVQPAQAQTFTVLHTFTGPDGAAPQAHLTLDSAGNLYGTAPVGGGELDIGTAFKLSRKNGSWIFSLLYVFQSLADVAAPNAVVFGPDGSLYGSSRSGGGYLDGTVFRLTPPATICAAASCPWVQDVIHRFLGHSDGCTPTDIVFDASGNIFGATSDDLCNTQTGTIYELTPSGGNWTKSLLYTFPGNDGSIPNSALVIDGSGNMYGTTEFSRGSGGEYFDFGTVYQFALSGSGWIHTTLYSFTDRTGGAFPQGVILDPMGDFFGVTPEGGSNNTGTAFELTSGSGGWTFNAFFNFTGPGQCGPGAPVTLDAQGNLYGVTLCDGHFGDGTVFKLTPTVGGGWIYSDLHDFDDGPDGGYPAGAVVLDASGNIYGTASRGGNTSACDGGCGVVWEITP